MEDFKKEEQRKKTFNGLCASEWAALSRSVWNDVSSTRKKKHLDHGATYPEKLCDRLVSMYSKKGDEILDPFLGTGTTLLSAVKAGRFGVGIELTDRFFEVAKSSINENLKDKSKNCTLIQGDCASVLKSFEADRFQLTVTSPPYADLIHKVVEDRSLRHKKSAFVLENNATTNVYSLEENDLGNMPLDAYLVAVEKIMVELYRVTKPLGYAAWVVKDYRDTKNKIPYVDLHSKIAAAGEKAGFKYHDLIVWDQNEHRKLVLLGYPSVFYVNQNNSFIVILRKS